MIVEHEPIPPESSKSSKADKQAKQAKREKQAKSSKSSKQSKSKSVERVESDQGLVASDSRPDLGGEVTEPAGPDTATTRDVRETDADRTKDGGDADSVGHAARAAASAHPKSLLDRVEDDLPAAVTPRKRARKRATRPAGQPTPAT